MLNILIPLWLGFLFTWLFVMGCAAGSFLNVCIARLPRGRSLVWPPSCCGSCLHKIQLRDNLPLLSYWQLRGRCRTCGAGFSMRYFWVEFLTGLAFAGQYYLEIGRDVHYFSPVPPWWYLETGNFPAYSWPVFLLHALMLCCLIVALFCTWEGGNVPTSVTITATTFGLAGALLLPWPYPIPLNQAIESSTPTVRYGSMAPTRQGPNMGPMPAEGPWWSAEHTPYSGVYSWPVWGPLPDWLPPESWQLGLATGLAGLLGAGLFVGAARWLFNAGLRNEAFVLGEVQVSMIAGVFLGWQPVLMAFLIALVPALLGMALRLHWHRRPRLVLGLWLPFGLLPSWLAWTWIGPLVQPILFSPLRLLLLVGGCWALLLALGALFRLWVLRTEEAPVRLSSLTDLPRSH